MVARHNVLADHVFADWRDAAAAPKLADTVLGGHGGGNSGLMDGFVRAVSSGDSATILSGPEETLETHLMVFTAERARHERRVVDVEV
jgi:hypothetical protein